MRLSPFPRCPLVAPVEVEVTRTMRDAVNPSAIPLAGCDIAAGYVNGAQSQWPAAGWTRFEADGIPTARIDVIGDAPGAAGVLDIENGDATPDTAPQWIRERKALTGGGRCVLYVNRSNITAAANACQAAGLLPGRDFSWWIATLDGQTKTVADMTGVVAVQWISHGSYDESVVYDATWHPTGTPAAPTLVKVTATATFSDGSSRSWSVP